MTCHGAVLALFVMTACGGQTARDAPDAGSGSTQDASPGAADSAGGGPTPVVHSMFLTVLHAGDGCVPQKLVASAQGLVSCTVFVVLPAGAGCDASAGLTAAPADAAGAVRRTGVPSSSSVCMLAQLPESTWTNGSCAGSTEPGWCYAKAPPSGMCAQAIIFSAGSPPAGAEVLLGCD